jgi:3-phenylpropionate/cinnamic acid dioxygenase small subunit
MDSKIQQHIHKTEIIECFSRYAVAIDKGDSNAFAELFSKDCLWKWETENFKLHLKGKKALKELADVVSKTCPGAQHLISNHVVTVAEEKAHCVCALMVFLSRPEGIYATMQGFYNADLVQEGGRWLISELQVQVLNPEICQQGKIGEYWAGISDYLQKNLES